MVETRHAGAGASRPPHPPAYGRLLGTPRQLARARACPCPWRQGTWCKPWTAPPRAVLSQSGFFERWRVCNSLNS